jgi:lysophospholipase L1-like esterase
MADFLVQDGQTYIFQGDSITDAGRRTTAAPFGTGYAKLTVDLVTAKYPERKIHWINKGIGGNRVTQLAERWTDDVIRHEPDWVSILIGINDVHSMLRHAEPVVSVDLFREKYDEIVSRTIAETGAQVLIIDPFYMSIDSAGMDWRTVVLEALPAYIKVARETAARHGCRHIPMHDIYQEQLALRESEVLCPEPVHPGPTGHMCIANAILEALTE